jgi:hypothetical protein
MTFIRAFWGGVSSNSKIIARLLRCLEDGFQREGLMSDVGHAAIHRANRPSAHFDRP